MNRKYSKYVFGVAISIGFISISSISCGNGFSPFSADRSKVLVGDIAPNFQLHKLEKSDNESVDFYNIAKNKYSIIVFWAIACGPTRDYIPILNRLAASWIDKGFVFILINLDGHNGYSTLKSITSDPLRDSNKIYISGDQLSGKKLVIAGPYGVLGTPATYFITPNKIISYIYHGVASYEELEREINKMLPPLKQKKFDANYGYVDSSEKIIIAPIYQDAREFHIDGWARIKVNNKWGFIDNTGKYVIEPQYEYCWDFLDGKAKVRLHGGDIKHINKHGDILD